MALGDALAELIDVFGWEYDDVLAKFVFDMLGFGVEGEMVNIWLWFKLLWVLYELRVFIREGDNFCQIWIPLSELLFNLFYFMMLAIEVIGVVVGSTQSNSN